MKVCKVCGHQNWSDDDFCTNCGKPLELTNGDMPQEPPKQRKTGIGEFSYLIYWIVMMTITGVVITVLYFFFGFWIEIISFIVTVFIIFGFVSIIFVALIEWTQENKELKMKRKLFKEKTEKMEQI